MMTTKTDQTISLHPKQAVVWQSKATEILFGGAAGGGKSHLMRVVAAIGCMQTPGLQVYLFRRESTDLEKNHLYGPSGLLAMLAPYVAAGVCRYNSQKRVWSFSNGARIFLCHCQYEKDVFSYQGAEIHLLCVDELTHFTESMYRFLRGRCRISGATTGQGMLAGRLPLILCASNPGGVGHNWVKAKWIDPAPPFKRWKATDDGGLIRQYIPSLLADNPSISDPEEYAQRLAGLGSPALVQAMLEGSWDIVAGGMFDDLWNPARHVCAPFQIPRSWRLDRSFDWGSAKPFSVGWWAESDGTAEGDAPLVPRGTLFRVGEWYGWNGTANEGCRMIAAEVGRGIIERERQMFPGRKVMPGPADSAIWTNENGACIADDMARAGCRWDKANKRPGSRKNGWEAIRRRLKASAAERPEEPGLICWDTCRHYTRTMPTLPRDKRDPDDADSASEDHIADEVRYRCLDDSPPAAAVGWFGQA